ncbi:hypothetical protein AUP68_16358 [Ilyonectria robusta]
MTESYFIAEGEIMSRIFIKTMWFAVEHYEPCGGHILGFTAPGTTLGAVHLNPRGKRVFAG